MTRIRMAPENAMKAIELRSKLATWRKATGARMPSRNPAYDPEQKEGR